MRRASLTVGLLALACGCAATREGPQVRRTEARIATPPARVHQEIVRHLRADGHTVLVDEPRQSLVVFEWNGSRTRPAKARSVVRIEQADGGTTSVVLVRTSAYFPSSASARMNLGADVGIAWAPWTDPNYERELLRSVRRRLDTQN